MAGKHHLQTFGQDWFLMDGWLMYDSRDLEQDAKLQKQLNGC